MSIESVIVASTAYPLLVKDLSKNFSSATETSYVKKCVVGSLVVKFDREGIEKINILMNSLPFNIEISSEGTERKQHYGRILTENSPFIYCIYNNEKKPQSVIIRKHQQKKCSMPLLESKKLSQEAMNELHIRLHYSYSCLAIPFEKSDIYPISIAMEKLMIDIPKSFTVLVGNSIEEATEEVTRGGGDKIEFYKKTIVDTAAEEVLHMMGNSSLSDTITSTWNSLLDYWG